MIVNKYEQIFSDIIDGKLGDEQIKKFLLELNQSDFPPDVFLGATRTLRSICKKISAKKKHY